MRCIHVWECAEIPRKIAIAAHAISADLGIEGRWAKGDIEQDKGDVGEPRDDRSGCLVFSGSQTEVF